MGGLKSLMENIIFCKKTDLAKITSHRSGEVKFGEKMHTIPDGAITEDYIRECKAKFVLLGIPEDIGVRANAGRGGTETAWDNALRSIVNIQHNRFCKGSDLLVLGQIDTQNLMKSSENLQFSSTEDRHTFSMLVEALDKEVSHTIFRIIQLGKIPIIIGGGHNNAYGNIKGTALAYGKPVNVVNFDAHSDFRILEGRHSGNGFSYAFDEGFLKRYFIFGLHESFTSKNVLQRLNLLEDRVRFNTYDEIAIRQEKQFSIELDKALNFVKTDPFGIEIDLDSVPGIASSAMTLTGFSVQKVRQFINHFASNNNAQYLHICEGAPVLADDKNPLLVGKLIGYLVTDFMKAISNQIKD